MGKARIAIGIDGNDRIYIVGGFTSSGNYGFPTYEPSLYSYNTATNSWNTLTNMPVPQTSYIGAEIINDIMYVLGTDQSFRYYISSNTWDTFFSSYTDVREFINLRLRRSRLI